MHLPMMMTSLSCLRVDPVLTILIDECERYATEFDILLVVRVNCCISSEYININKSMDEMLTFLLYI